MLQTAAARQHAESQPSDIVPFTVDEFSVDPESIDDAGSDPIMGVSSMCKDTTDSSQPLFESVDRKELVRLQQSDSDLATLFELVDQLAHGYQDGVLLRL